MNTLSATTLKELEIGDIFISASELERYGKGKEFLVIGSSMFNIRHGRATRQCINLKTKEQVGKSSPMRVYKTRESKNKEEIIKKYAAPKAV